jgi:hypothetical protein
MSYSPNVIPPDSESVFTALTTLQTSNPTSYNAIVRPNNPPVGIGGFLFDIPGDEEIRLRSQITNYYLESNTTVQDNIALEPAQITLRGLVAELSMGLPMQPAPATSPNPLPTFAAMSPAQTPGQIQNGIVNAPVASAASGGATSLYSYYENYEAMGSGSVTRQTAAFLYFMNLWSGQQLCSVETPWGIWQNCAILEIRAMQEARTRYESDFTITFQELRFAQDATVQTGNLAGRIAPDLSPVSQNGNAGKTQATPAQNSLLYSIFGPTTPAF